MTKDIYTAKYEFQNIGTIDKVNLPNKVKLAKPLRIVFEFSSCTTASEIWNIKQPIIKNDAQKALLKSLQN